MSFDPCTVVSLLPYAIHEEKPQLKPEVFDMPATDTKEPAVIIIQSASRPFYVDHLRGVMTLPYEPEKVARSIVEDHVRATIHTTEGAKPALHWLNGAFSVGEIKAKHRTLLDKMQKEQNSWFSILVKIADDTWQRYRRHNTISDQHRMAARLLGLKREWSDELRPQDQVECGFCTTLISNKAFVCPVCRMPQEGAINAIPDEKARVAIRNTLKIA